MSIEPGDAFAIKVNSHKHLWNGQVCTSPIHWNCGTAEHFRESQCERGVERCFHLKLFANDHPKLVIPDPSVVQFASANQSFLDDQILFFYGQNFDLKSGRPNSYTDQSLYGVYRVKRSYLESASGSKSNLVVEPYSDGWAIFPRNVVRKPPNPAALDGVSYLTRLSARTAFEALRDAREVGESMPITSGFSAPMRERLAYFSDHFENWAETAKDHLRKQGFVATKWSQPRATAEESNMAASLKAALNGKTFSTPTSAGSPPSELSTPIEDESYKSIEAVVPETPPPDQAVENVESWRRSTLPEPECHEPLALAYGDRLLTALQIATLTKNLLILTGAPGVGKSWLASRLINDENRERSEIVPVSSTWRGREDLLGYVNPVDGEFEPTSFTRFLRRCERAWDSGDRRTWLVVFEEFNLSQPEHWLSDLLVRLEFDPERRVDRTISFGGIKIAGDEPGVAPAVFLPPNLVFAATLNNDHTVRPLSPRVLDRAALIEVSATGRAALQRVGLEVSDDVEEVVEDLNDLLEARGVAFSVRAAKSLKNANELRGASQVMSNLDHVLAQEVLSKVRLMAGDPRDELLLSKLRDWGNRPASSDLMLCRERLALWDDALQAGRDVFQA